MIQCIKEISTGIPEPIMRSINSYYEYDNNAIHDEGVKGDYL